MSSVFRRAHGANTSSIGPDAPSVAPIRTVPETSIAWNRRVAASWAVRMVSAYTRSSCTAVGQDDAPPVLLQQVGAEAFLHAFEFPAHRGTADAQQVGCGVDASGVGNGLQCSKRFDVELHW